MTEIKQSSFFKKSLTNQKYFHVNNNKYKNKLFAASYLSPTTKLPHSLIYGETAVSSVLQKISHYHPRILPQHYEKLKGNLRS